MELVNKKMTKLIYFLFLFCLSMVTSCRKDKPNQGSPSEPSSPISELGCSERHHQACVNHQAAIAMLAAETQAAITESRILEAIKADLRLSWNQQALTALKLHQTSELESYNRILDLQIWLITAQPTATSSVSECSKVHSDSECTALVAKLDALQESFDSTVSAENLDIEQLAIASEINYQRHIIKFGLQPRAGSVSPSHSDEQKIADLAIEGVRSSIQKISRAFGSSGSEHLSCHLAQQSLCQEVAQTIANLRRDLTGAITAEDTEAARNLTIKINHQSDLLDGYKAGYLPDSTQIDQINQKHAVLAKMFSSMQTVRLSTPTVSSSTTVVGDESAAQPDSHLLPPREIVPSVRHPYSDAERIAVNEVMADFGDLYIGSTGMRTETYPNMVMLEAKQPIPWTSYYYPVRKKFMFEVDSPLAKFDQVVAARGLATAGNSKDTAVYWEERNNYNEDAAEWAGHCDAWVAAAMHTPEPLDAVVLDGITFTPDDLKALRLKQFEGWQHSIYGNRYEGDAATYRDFQDLRPEAVHKIIETVVGEQGQVIGIDSDPSAEIWNKPLYGMSFGIKPDPDFENAYYVYATARLVDLRRTPPTLVAADNYFESNLVSLPTSSTDLQKIRWEYRLFVDPDDQKDGKFRVIYGEWLGQGLDKHPDMVYVSKPNDNFKPANPAIAANLSLIEELFATGEEPPEVDE